MKKIITALMCAALCFCLASCEFSESVAEILGFDTHDYAAEAVIAAVPEEAPEVAELCAVVRLMLIDSPMLTGFSGVREANALYRDSVLNFLLNENYSKYTGNTDLLDAAIAAYPQLQITTLIPADDYSYAMYKNFGGDEKISNGSGKIFTYLDKIDAYTSVCQPQKSTAEITFIACDETENTYRFRFKNELNSAVSPEYFALFIKRADGTMYLSSLSETGK